jgi:hypothetical protein
MPTRGRDHGIDRRLHGATDVVGDPGALAQPA